MNLLVALFSDDHPAPWWAEPAPFWALYVSSAAIGLIWRIKLAHAVAASCAPIGASFTFLALATGSIWGKPMWGTWWVWDARITSELILLFLYLGYMALRSSIDSILSFSFFLTKEMKTDLRNVMQVGGGAIALIVGETLFLRSSGRVNWFEDEEGLFYSTSLRLYQSLGRRQLLTYEWSNSFETEPEDRLKQSTARLRWSQRFARDWILL